VTLSSVHDLAWTSPDIMIVLLILAVLATVILNLRSA
jgi:F0F1-type ATP synthase assembly protein I